MRFPGLLFLLWMGASLARADMIPVSDALFLGSVLDETWDIRNAYSKGYIEGMVPLTDVDLSVNVKAPGPVPCSTSTQAFIRHRRRQCGPAF